jgi:hypothetical protein
LGNLHHGLLILRFFGGIVELRVPECQVDRVMPHQFFQHLKGHPGIEEVGGKGMPLIQSSG